MAWTSPETKMDTGQLYVTTDGEHYTPVSELSINGVEFVPDVTTATEMFKLQERIEEIQAEIKRIEREEKKKKISHLAYILTMLGTNSDLSIEKRKWCCDELAEMYLSGDLDDIFYAILPRCNGKMIFQRMLEWVLEELGCKVYRARKLSGYPTIAVKPHELYDVEVFPNLSVVHKVSPEGKIYKRSVLTKDDLEDCLKGDLDDFVESLESYKCKRWFWENVNGPINYGSRLGIDVFPEELKPISSTGTIKENFAYVYLGENNENKTNNEKETKKMNARKCERCGKLYEVTEWPATIEAGNENLNRTSVRFKYMELPPDMMEDLNESGLAKQQTSPITINKVLQPTRYESKQEAVTLCPHCLKSLKDWFEMKEETVTKEAET